ncbi:MAG: sortase [Anaerolineae bacterium]|nr:sortase [Anaerolineae bacterium]
MKRQSFHTGLSFLFIIILMLLGQTQPVAATGGEGLRILIPAIQIEAPIVPVYIREFPNGDVTWDVSNLQMAVGHFEGLPNIGQGGNIVLGGHSERERGEADVFYNLHRVSVGDSVIVTADDTSFHYEVEQVFSVPSSDLSVLYPSNSEQLTLITCDLASYQAENGAYSRRTVVVARRVE